MVSFLTGFTRLRVRLAAIVAVALAPVGVLAFVQAMNGLEANADRREEELQALAQVSVDQGRTTIAEIRLVAARASIDFSTRPSLLFDCKGYFAKLAAEHDWMTRGVLVSPEGEAVCGADGAALNVADTEHWKRFVAHPGFVISAAQTGRLTGKRIFAVYNPVSDARGKVAAVAIGVDLSEFDDITAQKAGLPDFALLGFDGQTMFKDDETATWLPEDRSRLLVFGDRTLRLTGADGIERAYFASAIDTGQLWAVSARELPTWGDLAASPEGSALLVPIALWMVAVAVAYFAIDHLVSRHIDGLRSAAFRIGQGHLDTPIGDFAEAPRELRALGHSIRAMATRISDRETRLQETLETQRRLLLEVHHRVKNNLQTISSLMNIETRRARDPDTHAALKLIQDRIHALALVHQNLYEAENLERIALDRLVGDVCRHLESSIGPRSAAGRIVTALDGVVVDTVVATPVALFLSEAVSNAYKHADAAAPEIRVDLKVSDDGFSVEVSNRVDPGRAPAASGGLGVRLMSGFAKQIGGRLEVLTDEARHRAILHAPPGASLGLFAIRRAGAA